MNDNEKRVFADRLLKALGDADMTQRELAQRIGATEVTISRYVNGTSSPSAVFLPKIATTLTVDTDWLIGRRDTKTASDVAGAISILRAAMDGKDGEFSEGLAYAIRILEAIR